MAKKVIVTSAQRAAAQGLVKRSKASGVTVRTGVAKIADAKPLGKSGR